MLLLSDGFDSHATGSATLADGDSKWGAQSGVTVSASGGRFGGKALYLAATVAGSLAFSVPGAANLAFAGYFRVGAVSGDLTLVGDDAQALLRLKADRSLEVRDGGGTLRTSAPAGSLPEDTYVWVEVSYRPGGVNINLNGAGVGTPYVGAYTAPNEDDMRLIDSAGTGIGAIFVDDFIVWDNAGSYFNAYGLAPRRIQLLRPNADGTVVDWTPAGTTNWESVDATTWDGGDGVTATVNGTKDRYGFASLSVNPGSIDAVVVKTRVQNLGGDPATIAHVSGQGVAEASGAPLAVPTIDPGTLSTPFYRDPSGAVWTASTVNSAEFGQTLGI